jgi:hypothetical protein
MDKLLAFQNLWLFVNNAHSEESKLFIVDVIGEDNINIITGKINSDKVIELQGKVSDINMQIEALTPKEEIVKELKDEIIDEPIVDPIIK